MTLLEGLCIKVVAFFHFLAVFLALRFTLMTWSLVWFLHQPEQQLLVFWNAQQQIDSGPKCSLRTFLLPAFPCAFLGQAHGESSRKSYCLKLQWLFNHCGLPENRSGLQSCLWWAHYQFVQEYKAVEIWFLNGCRAQILNTSLLWNAETSRKVKKRNLKKMGVSLSVFFLLVTQCCNIYIGKLS